MFAGPNFIEITEKVDQVYSDAFIQKICKRLKIQDEEDEEAFGKALKKSAIGYLNGVDINSDRIPPYQQEEILSEYAKALQNVREKYKNVLKYNTTSAKLNKSLHNLVSQTKEPSMKEMFHPYIITEPRGTATTLFENFLGILIKSAEKAPNQDIGNDTANLKKNILAWWIASIRLRWPKYADVPFNMGSYYKELKSYKSECIDILYILISEIDPTVTRKMLETNMKKVIKLKETQPLANFILL